MIEQQTPQQAASQSIAEQEISILSRIGGILSATLDLREAFPRIMQLISDEMDLHRGSLVMLDEATGQLRTEAAIGLSEEERDRARYAVGEGITGTVVATGRPKTIRDVRSEPDF